MSSFIEIYSQSGLAKVALAEYFRHDSRLFNTGQLLIESLEFERESRMVDPHAMQNRGIQIIDVHRITNNVVAKIIGLAVNVASLDATACQPNTKVARMMVASIVVFGQCSL